MFVRRLVRPVRDCNKNIERNQKEKSQSRYNSRIRGGALIPPIAVEVCTFVMDTNFINQAIFGSCMLSGLVRRANLGFFQQEADMALQQRLGM
jgi:hypothetical protein